MAGSRAVAAKHSRIATAPIHGIGHGSRQVPRALSASLVLYANTNTGG